MDLSEDEDAWRGGLLVLRAVFTVLIFSPLSGAAGEFFHAVRNDFRQLHHLLAQFGVFRNVALNAVAIGLQLFVQRPEFNDQTINFTYRSF